MKKKLSIKQKIKYMFTSNFGRLAIAGAFLFIGGILGTDGLLEIESQKTFWDYAMYLGTLVLLVYAIYGIYWAIRNTIKDIKD